MIIVPDSCVGYIKFKSNTLYQDILISPLHLALRAGILVGKLCNIVSFIEL